MIITNSQQNQLANKLKIKRFLWRSVKKRVYFYASNIYLFKVNNKNIRKRCEIYLSRSRVFIVNFEYTSYLFQVPLLLTLKGKCQLVMPYIDSKLQNIPLIFIKFTVMLQNYEYLLQFIWRRIFDLLRSKNKKMLISNRPRDIYYTWELSYFLLCIVQFHLNSK